MNDKQIRLGKATISLHELKEAFAKSHNINEVCAHLGIDYNTRNIPAVVKKVAREAVGILQYHVDIINSLLRKCESSETARQNYAKFRRLQEDVEAMLLIYNIFADNFLELVDNDDTRVYTLVETSS